MGEILNHLFENLMKDLLEHLPGIRDLIHDLAEDLQTQEHVENDFGIICQNLILLDHLLVKSLV